MGARVQITLLGPQRRPTVDQVVAGLDADTALRHRHRRLAGARARRRRAGRAARRPHGQPQPVRPLARHPGARPRVRVRRARAPDLSRGASAALPGAARVRRRDDRRCSPRRNGDRPEAIQAALADARAVVRLLDDSHTARVRAADEEFADGHRPADRPVIAEHREAVLRDPASGSARLVVAGGHVGVLLRAAAPLRRRRCRPRRRDRLVRRCDGADRPRGALPRPHPAGALALRDLRRRARPDPRRGPAAARQAAAEDRRPAADGHPGPALRARDVRRTRRRRPAEPGAGRRPAAPTPGCSTTRVTSCLGGPRDHRRDDPSAATGWRSTGCASVCRWTPREIDDFLETNTIPIVEGARCTFLFRGEADEVWLCQRIVGLPEPDPAAAAARHRPLVPGARAAGGLADRVPDRDPARRPPRALQRPAEPAALQQPDGPVVGVLRLRLRDAGVDAPGPGGAHRRAHGVGDPQQGARPRRARSRSTCRRGSAVRRGTRCSSCTTAATSCSSPR